MMKQEKIEFQIERLLDKLNATYDPNYILKIAGRICALREVLKNE